MKKLSHLENLDFIFFEIKKENGDYTLQWFKARIIEVEFEISDFELKRILAKLVKDSNVLKVEYSDSIYNDKYIISVEGSMFEGYIKQQKQIAISNRNEYIRTLLLTYGTTAAGAYGIFEILKWLFHHEGWKLFF